MEPLKRAKKWAEKPDPRMGISPESAQFQNLSKDQVDKFIQKMQQDMEESFSGLEASFFAAKRSHSYQSLEDALAFRQDRLEKSLDDMAELLKDVSICQNSCGSNDEACRLLALLQNLPDQLKVVARVQLARLQAGLLIHKIHLLDEDLRDGTLQVKAPDGADSPKDFTPDHRDRIEEIAEDILKDLDLSVDKDIPLIQNLSEDYLRHINTIKRDLKDKVTLINRHLSKDVPADYELPFFKIKPARVARDLKAILTNRWYVENRGLMSLVLQEIRALVDNGTTAGTLTHIITKILSAELKLIGAVPNLCFAIHSIYSAAKRTYRIQKELRREMRHLDILERERKHTQKEINKIDGKLEKLELKWKGSLSDETKEQIEAEVKAIQERRAFYHEQTKQQLLLIRIKKEEINSLKFRLALDGLSIGNGFRKAAASTLSIATNLVTLISYGIRSGGDLLKKIAPLMQAAAAAGIVFSSVSLALSGIEFGFAFKKLYTNYGKGKDLEKERATCLTIQNHKVNNLPKEGQELLKALLDFEKERQNKQALEIIYEKKKLILGLAATSLAVAAGVFGLAAIFTEGVTLGALLGVSIGISIMTSSFMVYQHFKEKKWKKEQEKLDRSTLTHEALRVEMGPKIQALDLEDNQETLELIAQILKIKKAELLLDPTYYLKKHFKLILSKPTFLE
ncbi:MAG: hypothetical protein K0S07_356 [Chlamydiales bacterium]|jgi:hypothetical protein|nr:hypothetical protein [Chlamydiales bacterium]